MRTIHIFYLLFLFFTLSCNSSNKTNQSTNKKNSSSKPSENVPLFHSNIPPEFVRLKGRLIQEIESQDIQAHEVKIHFKITDILGFGATFSEPLQAGDTIVAMTKFGYNSIEKSSIDSFKKGSTFIAEMEGNPIISNKYTIYKLSIIK